MSADATTLLGFAMLGLAGSLHCAGMCGGFALSLAAAGDGGHLHRLGQALLFGLGKATTYTILGILLSELVGARVAAIPAARTVLAVGVGVVLIATGLSWAGLLVRLPLLRPPRRLALAFARATSATRGLGGSAGAFGTGLVIGFLPCGLSWSAFALALDSAPAIAALGLFLFGLATTPALTACALGAAFADRGRIARRALGFALIAFGAFTAMRGGVGTSSCCEAQAAGGNGAPSLSHSAATSASTP